MRERFTETFYRDQRPKRAETLKLKMIREGDEYVPTPIEKLSSIFNVELDGKVFAVCKTSPNLRGRGQPSMMGKRITTNVRERSVTVVDAIIRGGGANSCRPTDAQLEMVRWALGIRR